MKKKAEKPITLTPVSGGSHKPPCYGLKMVEHACITCFWQERCLYDSFKSEILGFKETLPEEYARVRYAICNTTSFEE